MEVKLGTLINAHGTLKELYVQKGLGSVAAYRISKIAKVADEEIKNYNEQRMKLCEKYANKDDEGKAVVKDGNYDISEENMMKFIEELEKLREETVEIPCKKVTLEDIDCAGLSPAMIDSIEFMLEV